MSECSDKGLNVAAEWGIPTERRIRRKKKMDGEKATGAGLTLVEEIDSYEAVFG